MPAWRRPLNRDSGKVHISGAQHEAFSRDEANVTDLRRFRYVLRQPFVIRAVGQFVPRRRAGRTGRLSGGVLAAGSAKLIPETEGISGSG